MRILTLVALGTAVLAQSNTSSNVSDSSSAADSSSASAGNNDSSSNSTDSAAGSSASNSTTTTTTTTTTTAADNSTTTTTTTTATTTTTTTAANSNTTTTTTTAASSEEETSTTTTTAAAGNGTTNGTTPAANAPKKKTTWNTDVSMAIPDTIISDTAAYASFKCTVGQGVGTVTCDNIWNKAGYANKAACLPSACGTGAAANCGQNTAGTHKICGVAQSRRRTAAVATRRLSATTVTIQAQSEVNDIPEAYAEEVKTTITTQSSGASLAAFKTSIATAVETKLVALAAAAPAGSPLLAAGNVTATVTSVSAPAVASDGAAAAATSGAIAAATAGFGLVLAAVLF